MITIILRIQINLLDLMDGCLMNLLDCITARRKIIHRKWSKLKGFI